MDFGEICITNDCDDGAGFFWFKDSTTAISYQGNTTEEAGILEEILGIVRREWDNGNHQ